MAFKIGTLSSPTFVKSILRDAKPVQASAEDIVAQEAAVSFNEFDSFKYDPITAPLKSTQQLKIDWSKFENHTFFSSAEVKVNDAFDALINRFPFDGTKIEVQNFLDSLTGFENYVYEQFPTWSGALHFSGTQTGENPANGYDSDLGTWISVRDRAGYNFPEISKNKTGERVIIPESGSMSIEAQIFLPEIINDTQVIFQKLLNETNGLTFYLKPSSNTSYVTASFCISSGSKRADVSAILSKGAYNHVCLVFNKDDRKPNSFLQFYLNENLSAVSTKSVSIDRITGNDSYFYIGTGSSFYVENTLVVPTQTFSGSLDELRIFHSIVNEDRQKLYATRGIYSTPDLKLYYRFNEPPPLLSATDETDVLNSIVLDSSGNSLHAYVNNFTGSLRVNATNDQLNPIKNEKRDFNIVLFPAYEDVKNLNTRLLTSASLYDDSNPNYIVKLVPKHYLLEGAAEEGFINELGNAGNPYSGSGIPGQGKLSSTHVILTFLYIWSKFFDDIKLYVESFGNIRRITYNSVDNASDNFLSEIIKSYGFYFPGLFQHTEIKRFVDDSDGKSTSYTTGMAFKKVNAELMRRLIINIDDFIRSKGTIHSIKSFLRSIGIDPENSLKIREYGGYTVNVLGTSRNKRLESIAITDFVSSSLVITPPLSASRVEPGYPMPGGQFVTNSIGKIIGTNYPSDGLFTSGSWTVSCNYKFPPYKLEQIQEINQSLLRFVVTGSEAYANPGLLANVVAVHGTKTANPKIIAYLRPGTSGSMNILSSSPLLTMSIELPGQGIFDGERWNVSLGRKRFDEHGINYLSSSYFLRVGKSNFGDIEEKYTKTVFFNEKLGNEKNAFEFISSSFNASGSYLCVGNQQTIPVSAIQSYPFLNNTFEVEDNKARTTSFTGWVSNLKFWSKYISEEEWIEHVRNYKSSGVSNAKSNYNFVNSVSGSFGKLRLDTLTKQANRQSDANGNITFIDYTGNNLHTLGLSFGSGSSVVVIGDVESYSYLSPEFDESSTSEKIRIRGVANESSLSENPFATLGPAYSSNESFVKESPVDDTRLSIEFSLTDALDRDMITMFSSLEELGDAIGRPELMFSPDYPDLEILRDIYFNKLTDNLSFRSFLEFYRWFDNSISTFIEQLVPGKTRYKGTNFVIESHMLERHKREARHGENYISNNQQVNKETALNIEYTNKIL